MAQPKWFKDVFGFQEMNFNWTQKRFKLEEENGTDILVSVPSKRRFPVGKFECPSVAELRQRLVDAATGKNSEKGLTFSNIGGDAGALHRDSSNAGAVFQVASQFNCLEMLGPERRPEDGIAIYAHDKTQGPICAMACPAALVFRNYLVNGSGQAAGRQLDMLSDVAELLENDRFGYWDMQNGYCIPQEDDSFRGLASKLTKNKKLREEVASRLQVGIHWSTSVDEADHEVCQVFCSGLPLAYAPKTPERDWVPFARAILEGAYEATLVAASILAHQRGERVPVFLTSVGGGVFGNREEWIVDALYRALDIYRDQPIDVYVVHYRLAPDSGIFVNLEKRFRKSMEVDGKNSISMKRPAAAAELASTVAEERVKKRPSAMK